jgi:haloalkane dehalogenase
MEIVRTPDERFENLPDYPFRPNYLQVDGLRMHYIDEGDKGAETVLMLHGEPTWSFLYRKMIRAVVEAGRRAIAPDLIGFGKSDKPLDQERYTYQSHLDWLRRFMEELDLQNITLVCHDWGGLLGLRLAAEHETRFKRILAANTFLPTGDRKPSMAFFLWRTYSQKTKTFKVGKVVNMGSISKLSTEILAAYEAPFPNEASKAAARRFPMLVPVSPDDPAAPANRAAWERLKKWQKPFLTAFSDSDPIMRGGDKILQKLIPGASNQKHPTIEKAGHFLQEDQPEAFSRTIVEFIESG